MAKDYSHYFTRPSAQAARKRKTTTTPIIDFEAHINVRHLGVGKKYLIQTYGCQGNEADTENMRGILEQMGFEATTQETEADLIILNTCAIRENAENRVFGEIGRLKQYKKHHPDLILAVAGCMPQDESVVDRLLKNYPYVDIIFGTHNMHQLPYYLETAIHGKERVVEVYSIEGSIIENIPKRRENKIKAWVHIMFGCDEFCTYCIVPYTRGKERSRQPEAILDEVRQLANEGYQEVTLLGQNVNAYGRDFTDKDYTFANLLDDLRGTDMPRVRFMTSHPRDFDQATVDVLAKGGNLMPHIHLPVQSGSNKVLKKMNRKYTVETYLALVDAIYQAIPQASLTTDIIVGFPGETEEDFQATLEMVKRCRFEGAFTFIFSARANTPAANYSDETPMEEKKARLKRLNECINAGYLAGHQRFDGHTVEVLVDGESKHDDTVLAGYTQHNKLVNFKGPKSLIGARVPVNITEAKTWFLKGVYDESAQ